MIFGQVIVWGDSYGRIEADEVALIDPPTNSGIQTGDPLMAATKGRTALFASLSLVAGAGDTSSSVIDLSATYGSLVDVVITNATGPGVAAAAQIWVADDYNAGNPTLFTKFGGPLTATVTTSAVSYFSVEVPIGAAAMKVTAGSNTTNNVTISADISSVTAI